MQFLKALFLIALGVVLALFGYANWVSVSVELWGGLIADVKLPFLLLLAVLIGFLPTFLLYRARLWSMRRRLEAYERNAAMAQLAVTGTTIPVPAHEQAIARGADERMTNPAGVTTP